MNMQDPRTPSHRLSYKSRSKREERRGYVYCVFDILPFFFDPRSQLIYALCACRIN
jgi:hypothetical protein